MESDEKFNTFSLHCFNFLRVKLNLSPAAVDEYYANCLTDANFKKVFNLPLLLAPLTVRFFYNYIFRNNVDNDKIKCQKSREEFCSYIRLMCNSKDWFGELTVFERCFVTICFVLTCSEKASNDIKSYAHVSWREYFNEYTEEFYNKGGWIELRKAANSYIGVLDLIRIVNPELDSLDFLMKLSKSIENYMYFNSIRENISKEYNELKGFPNQKMEYSNKHKTYVISWIKFVVENGNASSFNGAFIQPPKIPSEATCILRVLKKLCNPYELKRENEKSLPDSGSSQISQETAISSPGKIQEPSTINEKLQLDKAPEEASSNSFTNNVLLQNTVAEKESWACVVKNFTGHENHGTNNVPPISSTAVEVLKKCNERESKILKKAGSQVSDNANCDEGTGQTSLNISNNDPLQNNVIEKERNDSVNENVTVNVDQEKNRVSPTSLVAVEEVNEFDEWIEIGKGGKFLYNRKANLGKAMRIQSSNSTKNVPPQNTEFEKDYRDDAIVIFTGDENDETNDVSYNSSVAIGVFEKSKKRKQKKRDFQISDGNLQLGEALEEASSNSLTNNVPLQNTVAEKESKGSVIENISGDESHGTNNVPQISSAAVEVSKKGNKKKRNKKCKQAKRGLQASAENLQLQAPEKAFSNSFTINVPLQNTVAEKESWASVIENFTGDENHRTNNVPQISSEAVEVSKTANSLNNFPPENTVFEKESETEGCSEESVAGDENDRNGKVQNNCLLN